MKAIQYLGANHIEVCEVKLPEVPEGWALIRVSHAGICGTDLNIYAGTHPRAKAPLIMGHEFSGVVVRDCERFSAGTRVTVYPLISCGHCEPCLTGNGHVCNTLGLYGIDTAGAMAEYVAIPQEKLIPLPEQVSFKLGALIEPIAVTVHTVRETGFTPGNNAIIFGCGTIGLCLALTLRQFGAGKMLLVETNPSRLALARELGFDVINPMENDLNETVAQYTEHNGFDHVYDCAGASAVAACLLDVVKVKGEIVIVASYKKPTQMPFFKGMAKETSIRFVRVYRAKDFEIAAQMVEKEPLYEKIITHVFSYQEAQHGFELLLTPGNDAVKVMFKFEE